MRWVKHLTMAHADKAMGLILEDLGAEAYGVFWLMIEDIAAPMEKGKFEPNAIHSVVKWSQICHCSARGFKKIADRLVKESLIVCESIDDRLRITIPNILKYKDEYAKKSGAYPDSKTDTDTHTETEREAHTDPARKPGSVVAFPQIRVSPEEEQRNLCAAEVEADWTAFVAPFPEQTELVLGQQYFGTILYSAEDYQEKLKYLAECRDWWLGSARWHNGYVKSVGGWFAARQYADRPAQCKCGTKDPLNCPLRKSPPKSNGSDPRRDAVLGKPSNRAISSSAQMNFLTGALAYGCR